MELEVNRLLHPPKAKDTKPQSFIDADLQEGLLIDQEHVLHSRWCL